MGLYACPQHKHKAVVGRLFFWGKFGKFILRVKGACPNTISFPESVAHLCFLVCAIIILVITMSAHAAALEILRKTSDPNAFRKIAEQQHQSLNSYETHLENDEFHGPPPTFDPKAYFELLPFKFRCAEGVKEAPVV